MILIAKAKPYEQFNAFQEWWYAKFPIKITERFIDAGINSQVAILGASGTGKSTLADNFDPSLAIDLHEESYRRYRSRARDPSLIDVPAGHAPQLGVIWTPDGEHPYSIVDSCLTLFRGQYESEGAHGERMQDILRLSLIALQKAPRPFAHLLMFLTDNVERNQILREADDAYLDDAWDHLTHMREFNTITESTRNKISAFLSNPLINQMFMKVEPDLDFYEAFKEGRPILCNISQRYYKDKSAQGLLCGMIMNLASQALFRRTKDKIKPPVVIVTDETLSYWGGGAFFRPLIVESRKFNCSLRMLFASFGSLSEQDIRVLMSCGHIVAFSCSRSDAERVAKEMLAPRLERFERDPHQETYWAPSQDREELVANIMEQRRGEAIWSVKTVDGPELYFADVCANV